MRFVWRSVCACFISAVAACAASTSGHAEWWGTRGPSADIWKFDIGGVRLHMSAKEAIEAIKKKFGSSLAVEDGKKYDGLKVPNNVILFLVCNSNIVAGKTYTCKISYTHNVGTYVFAFEESLPGEDDGRPEVADSITLDASELRTDADRQRFEQAVLEKYGMPTLNFGSRAEWCVVGAGGRSCNDANLFYGKIQGYWLRLSDPGYRLKVNDAYQRTVKAPKPKL